MPVYLIVAQDIRHPSGWCIYRILEVVKTTWEDAQGGKHTKELEKYQSMGQVTWYVFVREPDNPFREMVQ